MLYMWFRPSQRGRPSRLTGVATGLYVSWVLMNAAVGAQPSLSKEEKSKVLTGLSTVLVSNYVFPDKARAISVALRNNLRRGAYHAIATRREFAHQLTKDLLDATGDLHFSVGFDPAWIAEQRALEDPAKKQAAELAELERVRKINFGFATAGILEGNVGLIRFGYFADPDAADETAAAAMRMVENADALIFDLRHNRGGYMEMAQFLLSYLFAPSKQERLFFDYFYNHNGKRIERGQWLLPALPGKRMPDTPVYLVTSCTSFSAAEWFAFVLQKLKRATVIGEVTAGAAHSVDRKIIDGNFFVQTPIGQTKDPVDGRDFEGVGVKPDYPASASKGVAIAHRMALKNLASANPGKRAEYEWFAPVLAARIDGAKASLNDLRKATGTYEGRRLSVKNGTLIYHWGTRFQAALEPLTPTLFAIDGMPDLRFELTMKSGRVTALKRVDQDGSHRSYKRID